MKKLLIILTLGFSSCYVKEGDVVDEVRRKSDTLDVVITQDQNTIIVKHNTYSVGDTIRFCK